ncbi:hypothetical protein [Clostridium weizhouense]|uniref:Uncharacterized protein n=1 Tax=Clostridium weizhouense TaxID=2859781 RepID=A0ABS7ANA2_9CLOT|nr:hypothetical protein [Clostridium weizhouense]MBW6410136.1 hypothetical protein [Clostridium weizhouense]
MSNEQQNFKNNIKKDIKTHLNTNYDTDEQSNSFRNQSDEEQLDVNDKENIRFEDTEREVNEKANRKQIDKPLKIFGIICIAVFIIAITLSGTSKVDTSESAQNALKNGASTTVSAGTILLSKDENAGPKDYTITHKSDEEDTKIWVWDYAAEDGDYVQVLVNGAPIGDAFMIKHKPKEISVSSVGKVQIKGIKDGGGGITYAVRYDINETSYFNGTPEGESNTYTLTNK